MNNYHGDNGKVGFGDKMKVEAKIKIKNVSKKFGYYIKMTYLCSRN